MYHSAPIGADGALDQFGLPAVGDIFAQCVAPADPTIPFPKGRSLRPALLLPDVTGLRHTAISHGAAGRESRRPSQAP